MTRAKKQELTRGQKAAATRKANLEKQALAAQAAEYSAEHGTFTVAELKDRLDYLEQRVVFLDEVTIEALKVNFPLGNKTCSAELVDGQWHLSWE